MKDFYIAQTKLTYPFNIPFYEDQILINQTLFLLRDNTIIVYDIYEQTIENTFFFRRKDPVIGFV